MSISSSVGGTISSATAGDDKNSKAEEFTASFVAQTNWSFVEKLLKVQNETHHCHNSIYHYSVFPECGCLVLFSQKKKTKEVVE